MSCCGTIDSFEKGVLLRFGRYVRTVSQGFVCLIPCVDALYRLDMRDQVINLAKQVALTQDNITVEVDATVHYAIIDAAKAFNGVSNMHSSLLNRVAVEVRQTISAHPLSTINKGRSEFAAKIIENMADVEADWGIHIKHVQLNNIELDQALRAAMSSLAEAQVLGHAKVVNARAAVETADEYAKAAKLYDPVALRLREFQLWQTVSQQPGKTIWVVPSEMTGKLALAGPTS